MKNLSYWALMNPVKSIIIIVLCQLMLTAIAFYAGVWLYARDIILPAPVFYAGELLFFIALALYPIRRARHKFWKYSYARQKTMDMLMVASFMLIAISMSNSDANVAWNTTEDAAFAQPVALKKEQNAASVEKTWSKREVRKALRRSMKAYVAEMKAGAENDSHTSGKIAGMILLTIVLMLAIAVLACFVGCSGSGPGAALILVVGWTLMLVLCIRTVRKLKGQRKTSYAPMPQP